MGKQNQSGDQPKAPKRGRLVLFTLPVVALAAVAAAYFFFWPLSGDHGEQAATDEPAGHEAAETSVAGEEDTAEELALVPLREIIVNISATTASGVQAQRFLKLNLAMAYDEATEGAARLIERQPYIRDSFIDYLRLLNESDLRGSAGLARLRSELLHRARSLAETDALREVLVVDLVVQ